MANKIKRIHYPDARWMGNGGRYANGEGWGPLPDTGRGASYDDLRVVLHTTETYELPGYRNGYDAPHITFWPAKGRAYEHNWHNRRVGTLIGKTTTGVNGNEFSLQAEIICFSDRSEARKYASRGAIWVGDLTDEHLQQIADWISWIDSVLSVPVTKVFGPKGDFSSFQYGKYASTRMSRSQWLNAGGTLTSHGAAYGQSHWDTGALNLDKIFALATGGTSKMTAGLDYVKKGDGIEADKAMRERVRYWQRVLRAMGVYTGALDGIYGGTMEKAVAEVTGEDGSDIGSKEAFRIHRALIRDEIDSAIAALPPSQPSDTVPPHTHPHTHTVGLAGKTGPPVE